MAQLANVQISGLVTYPNRLAIPPGALAVAKNIVLSAPNEAQCRRGHYKYGNQITLTGGESIKTMFPYSDAVHIHYGDTLTYDSGAGTWADYTGTIDPADTNIGLRHVTYAEALYVNADSGVQRVNALGGTFVAAGLVPALDVHAVLATPAGTVGFMATNCRVAYRVTWKREGNDKRFFLSAPSGREEAKNATGATRDVTLTIRISAGITVADKVRVYRSLPSASSNDSADDELFLVYEKQPAAGDITAGYMTVLDDVKDAALGATIPTAPSQAGIESAGYRPPWCKDICLFNDHVFFANCRQPQRLFLTLSKVFKTGDTNGLTVDDTIAIAGVTYTAQAAESAEAGQFLVDEASADAGDRIENTALSLVRVINSYASNTTVYAYYVSGYADTPGKILIEARTVSVAAYTAVSATGGNWVPALSSSGTTVQSNSDERANRVYFSTQYQPDSVPLPNYFDIGTSDESIVRIIPGRSSIFVFTDGPKVYRIFGTSALNFSVALYDSTTKILGPRCAVSFDTAVFMSSERDVLRIVESGSDAVNTAIKDQTSAWLGNMTAFEAGSFAIAVESDAKYLLSYAGTIYVFDVDSKAWTTWDLTYTAGCLSSDDKLYFADASGYIWKERKTFTKFDFADAEFAVNVVSSSALNVVLTSVTNVVVGQSLKQTNTRYSRITAINGTTVTVTEVYSWQAGAATVYAPIECELQWQSIHCGAPGTVKRFRELVCMFREISDLYTIGLSSNFDESNVDTQIIPQWATSEWDNFEWGNVPWGGEIGGNQENRTYFPLKKQRALWANVTVKTFYPFVKFALNGVALIYEPVGEKFGEV